MKRPALLWIAALLATTDAVCLYAAAELDARLAARSSVSVEVLTSHAAALADDTFEGRETGTRGSRAAAGYIIEQLQAYKVDGGAAGGGFKQPFGGFQNNLLAVLPGSDPDVGDEVIIVGAHYDHVGYGNRSNSYGPLGYIHNGADDNASGVATVLEAAKALAPLRGSLRRTIVFAFWDGEEKGLLGSRHWLREPTVPVSKVRCAINLDMVGRLRDDLEVYGTRSLAGSRKLISRCNASETIPMQFLWKMSEDSDHFPFYERKIPSLMFHTGKHDDYHRPSDDLEKLNTRGMQSIARLLVEVIVELADAEDSPAFREGAIVECRDERNRENFERPLASTPGRLGLRWRPEMSPERGVMAAEVTRNTAAWRAGLRAGDRIIGWNGEPLRSYDRFQHLAATAAEPVTVSVIGRGETVPRNVDVTLDGAPIRIGISWIHDLSEPATAIIKRVIPASAAARAGLRPGDRIYAVNEKSFATDADFESLLNDAMGDTSVTIERNGQIKSMMLDIDMPMLVGGE